MKATKRPNENMIDLEADTEEEVRLLNGLFQVGFQIVGGGTRRLTIAHPCHGLKIMQIRIEDAGVLLYCLGRMTPEPGSPLECNAKDLLVWD